MLLNLIKNNIVSFYEKRFVT